MHSYERATCFKTSSSSESQNPGTFVSYPSSIPRLVFFFSQNFSLILFVFFLIQTAPKGLLPNMINKMDEKRVSQVWNRNGASCPDQTVPIRRSTVGANQVNKKHWNVPYPAEEGHEVINF